MKQFEEIWYEYYPKLTIYLRTSFHFHETDDLVQEIMMKVHTNLNKYNPRWAFSTWIYSIARNHAVDCIKKQQNIFRIEHKVKQAATVGGSSGPAADIALLQNELREDIASFINSLPENERQISFLKYYEEMNYRDISRITAIPQGTIKYHVHNIKKKFAAYYGENYED